MANIDGNRKLIITVKSFIIDITNDHLLYLIINQLNTINDIYNRKVIYLQLNEE